MAITEQQFIDAYKWLTPENQTKLYDRVNEEWKQWINNYNASLNSATSTNTNQWNMGGWSYWDTSADRQEQIVGNLNQAYAQDPSKFSDWNTFANTFNYNYTGRSDKERETMRNWYQYQMEQQGKVDYNNTNNTDYFLAQLMNGQTLGWTWAAATAAYNRYKDYQSLSGMTPEQIASAVSSNSVNPVGQSMIDLKNYSPELYAQVQSILQNQTEVNDINSVGSSIYDWLTKTETNSNYTKYNFTDEYAKNASVIKQYNESLYKKIEALGGDTAAYVSIVASMLQNPLIQANKDEIENIEWEINKIKDNIWTVADSARAVLWSEAPEDLVSAYISQQTKALQTQLRTLENSLLVAQWKLDNQLSDVDTLIDAINNWIKMYWEDGTSGSSSTTNNYQFVSWSKYQEAWYFDKNTWQFYKLWETPDTYDYQSSDPTRLQEIADNLVNIANSDDVYVFRNRSAFNDYFKYNKRSAAQKAVLDEFWNANSEKLKQPAQQAWQEYQKRQAAASKASSWSGKGSWWSGSWTGTTTDNDKWQKLKAGIINWEIGWSYDKGNVKRYGFTAWLNEDEVMVKMAQICKPSEYQSLYNALWASARKKFEEEINSRVKNVRDANADLIMQRMKDAWWSIGWEKREKEAAKLAEELWINFWDKWKNAILTYYKNH